MFERFDTPVRCAAGHVFTTIWIPFASVKAVRLGGERYQHCPVGHHWTTVVPLDLDGAVPGPQQLAAAARVHDIRIP
ncbi:MAG TPA: hypothetical protein VGM12_11055 [Trebonia sp.]|jgi:hypothetical protein